MSDVEGLKHFLRRFEFTGYHLAEVLTQKCGPSGLGRKLLENYHSRLASRSSGLAQTSELVARETNISPERFRMQYLEPSRPVVLEGFASHWAAFKKWDFSYFREELGTIRLNVGYPSHQFQEHEVREIVDRILNESEFPFANFGDLFEAVPGLQEDLNLDWVRQFASIKKNRLVHPKLFVAKRGRVSELHMDMGENLLAQLRGRKRMILFPYSSTPFLYPEPFSRPHNFSFLSKAPGNEVTNSLGSSRSPLLGYAQRFEAVLGPGDVLYLPAYFWHCAVYETPCIGVAHWWGSVRKALLKHPLFSIYSLKKILAMRNNRYPV